MVTDEAHGAALFAREAITWRGARHGAAPVVVTCPGTLLDTGSAWLIAQQIVTRVRTSDLCHSSGHLCLTFDASEINRMVTSDVALDIPAWKLHAFDLNQTSPTVLAAEFRAGMLAGCVKALEQLGAVYCFVYHVGVTLGLTSMTACLQPALTRQVTAALGSLARKVLGLRTQYVSLRVTRAAQGQRGTHRTSEELRKT
ncbi:hypothetical protein BKA67DRAFT_537244 [Truncatella angustata]|uniref:Uncharacterized protein n=1 Tax=Truncatella angustata TaxID=152316 RepID=A0A9P8UKD6_9PEZI|nr:uncharacterized protein BKA67DRAFT_537244 [Truncatella angustata]KAH6653608.1 hypothetical protein BKA67DRAFT_537244 [Truncatella angustata]